MTRIPVTRALISVSDKTGLEELARRLAAAGVELVASGGTATAIASAGLPVTQVADVTGAPEMLGGRVKTLHPRIHGGILADLGREEHRRDLERHDIAPFQLVVANLYPFRETVAGPDGAPQAAVEQIDIGGPALIRAAAKNHAWVGVVTSPEQYPEVAAAVEQGGLDAELRRRLAAAAFFHTASYDAAIVAWMHREEAFPEALVLPLRRHQQLRYGENPHQQAALYLEEGSPPWWRQLQGKEMSFNNHVDAVAARRHAAAHPHPTCVMVKHTNPCGVATSPTLAEAFRRAWECDPLSAYGSVIAVNRPLDVATAEAMLEAGFIEVVVAPAVDPTAEKLLGGRANLRLLVGEPAPAGGFDYRRLEGGFALQTPDEVEDDRGWQVVSRRQPSPSEWEDLRFAWVVAAHTKSNAIVIAREGMAVGVGAGDQSRVGAAERAVRQAGERAAGGVAASDAFFPFRDGIDALAAAGVRAVIQPGGSRRDDEVIAAADQHDLALVHTGRRHFTH